MFEKSFQSERPFGKNVPKLGDRLALPPVIAETDRFSLNRCFQESDDAVRAIPIVVETAQEFELVDFSKGDDAGTIQVKLYGLLDRSEIGIAGVYENVINVEKDGVKLQIVTAPWAAEVKRRAYFAKIPLR
jgi:hypothetical protein